MVPILFCKWQKYKPFMDAVEKVVSDPSNGITQVFLTGHSLGGSMVQYAMGESFINSAGFTWGSPGAKINPSNTNIVNFEHLNDVVPMVGSAVNHLVGTEIVINGTVNDTALQDFVSGQFVQHNMKVYASDTAQLIRDASITNNLFYTTSLAKALQ